MCFPAPRRCLNVLYMSSRLRNLLKVLIKENGEFPKLHIRTLVVYNHLCMCACADRLDVWCVVSGVDECDI